MKGKTAVLALGLALALASPVPAKPTTHDLTGEVVSVDQDGKTITIKEESGESRTIPVLPPALKDLDSVHPGNKVTLACQDNDKGEHQGVSAIKLAKVSP